MITSGDITSRPSVGDRDLAMMYDMVVSSPRNALHLADLPWRLCSPSARVPEQTRLWESPDSTVLACAVLQFPWHCLDYHIHHEARSADLEPSILDWAKTHLRAEAVHREEPLPFYISARQDDSVRITAIQRAGFSVDDWSYVHMARDLGESIPDPTLPEGFHLRLLAGEEEVEAYVATHRAAFGSANMTADWRRSTLRHSHYSPELDLVVVGPDGAIVAFCICWITPPLAALNGGRVAQVEPLGVQPEYHRIGLGRAVLLEAFRRAKAMGAQRMEVNAESYNKASQGAYGSVGFRPAFEMPFFRRSFG